MLLVSPTRLMAPAQSAYRPTLVIPNPAVPSLVTLPPSYSQTAGTVYCEFTLNSAAGTQVIYSIDDATANERITVRINGGTLGALVLDGGVTQCALALGAISTSTLYRVAFAWSTNDFAACINGGAVVTDSAGTLPTVNRMTLGYRLINTDPLQGTVGMIKYWPYRRPDGHLPTLR
jgi:hypothetical protein